MIDDSYSITKYRLNILEWYSSPHDVFVLVRVWECVAYGPSTHACERLTVVFAHMSCGAITTNRTTQCKQINTENLNVIQSLHFLTLRKRVFRSMHFIFLFVFSKLRNHRMSVVRTFVSSVSFLSFYFKRVSQTTFSFHFFRVFSWIDPSLGKMILSDLIQHTTMVSHIGSERAPTHTI